MIEQAARYVRHELLMRQTGQCLKSQAERANANGKILYGVTLAHDRREAHTALARLLAEELSPHHLPLTAAFTPNAIAWLNWAHERPEAAWIRKEIGHAIRKICQDLRLTGEDRVLALVAALSWGIAALEQTRGAPDAEINFFREHEMKFALPARKPQPY